jgi:hypothetical protein
MHKRLAPALVAVLLVGAAVTQSALAAPKGTSVPKYYAATAAPTVIPLPLLAVPVPSATATVTLTNCGSCGGPSSTQSFGSAQVRFPSSAPLMTGLPGTAPVVDRPGWSVALVSSPTDPTAVLQLQNSGTGTTYAVPPGQALTVTLRVSSTTTAGAIPFVTQVKQSNDFSGTGNDFTRSGADPTVYIGSGPATHLEFVKGPSNVQVTVSPALAVPSGTTPVLTTCPSVRALDDGENLATSFTGNVTLTPFDPNYDPGLAFDGTTQVAAVAIAGQVTFNTDTDPEHGCTGLSAANLGLGYQLKASSPSLAPDTSDPFDVLQFYAACLASCATPAITGTGTTASAQATSTSTSTDPPLLTFYVGQHHVGQKEWPYAADICNPDVGAQDFNPYRDAVTIDLAAHDKTVTLLWSKKAVQWSINNGASQWRVCLAATFKFHAVDGWATCVDDAATCAVGPATYVGALLPCGSSILLGTGDPCLKKLNKSGGQQQAVVLLPDREGDPKMY